MTWSPNRYHSVPVLITLFLYVVFPLRADAAFCSLRDPSSAIQSFYPHSSNYKSIVKTISNSTRNGLNNTLPIDMHFNEFGRHTLYVALLKDFPLGVIHSRSEASDWGLIEFSWAIDTQFQIEDFHFQRCRSPLCNDQLRVEISALLKGKDISTLMAPNLNRSLSQIISLHTNEKSAQDFADTILHSAMKTLALTKLEWGQDVFNLVTTYYASLSRIALNLDIPPIIEELPSTLSSPLALSQLEYLDINSLQSFKIMQGTELAKLATIKWNINKNTGKILFIFGDDGKVLHFSQVYGELEQDLENAFQSLIGKKVSNPEDCSTSSDLTAHALFLASNSSKARAFP